MATTIVRDPDVRPSAPYLGRGSVFDRAVADFAEACAGQNERDHAGLADAVRSARVVAERGV